MVRGYARETDRITDTYDDHFADPNGDHASVFYCPDQQLPVFEVFRVITAVVDHFDDRENLPPVVCLSANWL